MGCDHDDSRWVGAAGHLLQEIDTRSIRQINVQKNQGRLLFLNQKTSHPEIARLEEKILLGLQSLAHAVARRFFVVDDENRVLHVSLLNSSLTTGTQRHQGRKWATSPFLSPRRDREMNQEAGAFAVSRGTFESNPAAQLFYVSLDNRQAQASPAQFGREEGCKDLCLRFLRYPGA